MKTTQRLTIRDRESNALLASAGPGEFQQIEGNWYLEPSAVERAVLRVTDQEYHCPYKGRCLYIDFVTPERRVQRVAWTYDDVKPGWEHIKGKYAFYAGAVAEKIGKTKDSLE